MMFRKRFITEKKEVIELQVVYRPDQPTGTFNILLTRNHLVLVNISILDIKNDYPINPDYDNAPKIPDEAVKLFESFKQICNL